MPNELLPYRTAPRDDAKYTESPPSRELAKCSWCRWYLRQRSSEAKCGHPRLCMCGETHPLCRQLNNDAGQCPRYATSFRTRIARVFKLRLPLFDDTGDLGSKVTVSPECSHCKGTGVLHKIQCIFCEGVGKGDAVTGARV